MARGPARADNLLAPADARREALEHAGPGWFKSPLRKHFRAMRGAAAHDFRSTEKHRSDCHYILQDPLQKGFFCLENNKDCAKGLAKAATTATLPLSSGA